MIRAVLFDWGGTLVERSSGGRLAAVDGAIVCLRRLSESFTIGLVTNEMALVSDQIVAVTRGVGFEIDFAVVASPSSARAAKPEPAIFDWALRALNCLPPEVVMVGDDYEADVCGAKAVGLRTIWFNPLGRGRGFRSACEDGEVEHLELVPDVIAGWLATEEEQHAEARSTSRIDGPAALRSLET